MWKLIFLSVAAATSCSPNSASDFPPSSPPNPAVNLEFCEMLVTASLQYRSLGHLVTGLVLSIVLVWLAVRYYRPLNHVVELEEGGYPIDNQSGQERSAASAVRRMQEMKRSGRCPPVYPNGWYGLVESHGLVRGQTMSVGVLGLTLALFRDEKGDAFVLDAYCPHMGANLGMGGQVKEGCIECPFHGWRFRGEDGRCVEIPYMDSSAKSESPVKCELDIKCTVESPYIDSSAKRDIVNQF